MPDRIRIDVLDGARSGLSRTFSDRRVRVGRHPDADLRFDPERDRAVSTYHAVLARDERGWFVRDLDSRNGTFVGGQRIADDRRLRDGDTIRFGDGGPSARVRIGSAAVVAGEGTGSDEASRSTTAVIRRELGGRVHRLRLVAVALAVALAGVLAFFLLRDPAPDRPSGEAPAKLALPSESVLSASARTVDSLRGRADGLRDALARSRREVARLRAELERREAGETGAESDTGPSRQELRQRLQSATAALRRQQLAAEMDFAALEERNAPALAQIYVEWSADSIVSATAFAVRPDALLITARHVLRRPDGARPQRIAVQFARSRQVWPGRTVAVSERSDLALVRAEQIRGEVPTVQGLSARPDTLPSGAPLAVIGFPLGGLPPREEGEAGRTPEPLVTGGLLLEPMEGVARIQGYGERGASGSPVLDATGQVVAVLRGATASGGESVLVGIPSTEARRLLASLPEDAP